MMQLRRTEFMGEKLSTDVRSQNGSTKCISRLTKSIIYNIYYERRLLPEEFFVTRLIEGIPVKEFVPDTDNRRILKLNEWIEYLMNSIAKKELKSVCLELITLDTNKVIECYNMKYSYRDELTAKKIPEQYTATGIQKLLKNMKNIFTSQLNPLTDKRNLRFRMTADTSGRQSSVFGSGKTRMMEFTYEDEKVDIDAGTVCTPYHRLILRMKAEVKEKKIQDEDTENDVIIVEEESQVSVEPEIIEIDDNPDDEVIPSSNCSSNQTEQMEAESSKLYSSILEMSNLQMSCICDTQLRNSVFTIIQCKNCSTYQHAECYGIYKIAKIPGRHLCHDCSCLLIDSFCSKIRSPATGEIITQENNTHTDARLVEYTIGELKEIGRIRLVLMYVYREKRSPLHFIQENFNPRDFEKVLEKLIKHSILVQTEHKLLLNAEKVNIFIRKHFKPRYSISRYF